MYMGYLINEAEDAILQVEKWMNSENDPDIHAGMHLKIGIRDG